ncbi:MAG: hypothetical protein MSS42_10985, partial [Bacteroidales bacterium]|nr:hypothetical protein [Bacteroidales bacterium]
GSKHRNKNQLSNHFPFLLFFCHHKINQISLPIQDAIAYWEWIKRRRSTLGSASPLELWLYSMEECLLIC